MPRLCRVRCAPTRLSGSVTWRTGAVPWPPWTRAVRVLPELHRLVGRGLITTVIHADRNTSLRCALQRDGAISLLDDRFAVLPRTDRDSTIAVPATARGRIAAAGSTLLLRTWLSSAVRASFAVFTQGDGILLRLAIGTGHLDFDGPVRVRFAQAHRLFPLAEGDFPRAVGFLARWPIDVPTRGTVGVVTTRVRATRRFR